MAGLIRPEPGAASAECTAGERCRHRPAAPAQPLRHPHPAPPRRRAGPQRPHRTDRSQPLHRRRAGRRAERARPGLRDRSRPDEPGRQAEPDGQPGRAQRRHRHQPRGGCHHPRRRRARRARGAHHPARDRPRARPLGRPWDLRGPDRIDRGRVHARGAHRRDRGRGAGPGPRGGRPRAPRAPPRVGGRAGRHDARRGHGLRRRGRQRRQPCRPRRAHLRRGSRPA